jgi:NDP-sugar pyrophosphorylase family protein
MQQGLTDFVISSGYRGEEVADFAADLRGRGIAASVACEDVPLGTAGGFLNGATDFIPSNREWFV